MSRGFVSGDRKQLLLLPPSVDKWGPKKHVVRFIYDIVKQMKLTPFYSAYGTEGRVSRITIIDGQIFTINNDRKSGCRCHFGA